MSGHIKNSVKSIIFFGSGKKRGVLRPIKKKVFMVAEAPNGTPPLFYYYDIVAYFYIVCIP